PERALHHAERQRHAFHPSGTDVGLEPLQERRRVERVDLVHGSAERELDQEVGGRRRDRAAVPGEPRIREPPIRHLALDANAIAAERVHALEDGMGRGEAAWEARVPEALPDHVAVERLFQSASSPRAALLRYGGNRYALSRDRSPPCPSCASDALSTSSPVR